MLLTERTTNATGPSFDLGQWSRRLQKLLVNSTTASGAWFIQ